MNNTQHLKKLAATALMACCLSSSFAQSPQPLPYTQNFGVNDIFPYPAGIQGQRSNLLTFPITGAQLLDSVFSNRNTQADFEFSALVANTAQSSQDLNAATVGGIGGTNSALLVSLGARALALNASVDAAGRQNIRVSAKFAFTEFVGANDTTMFCQLQFRVGTTGNYTNVTNGLISTTGLIARGDSLFMNNIQLPAAANNQADVQIRWMFYANQEIPVGSRLSMAMDDISITGDPLQVLATQLRIDTVQPVSGPAIVEGRPFKVIVRALDATNSLASVNVPTAITLSLGAGTGTLGGTLTDTLQPGSSTLEISGATYSIAQQNVTVIASTTSGTTLTPSPASQPFNVQADPFAGLITIYQEDFETQADPLLPVLPTGYSIYNIDGAAPDPAGSPGFGQDAWVVRQTDAAWNNNTFFDNVNSTDPSATFVMASTSYLAPQPQVTDRWVVLPAVTLGPQNNILYFQAMSRGSASFTDSYTIYVSSTAPGAVLNPNNFEAIPNQGQYLTNPAPSRAVETVNVPLPPIVNGLTLYFAFRNNTPTPGGDRLFIDNIRVMYNNNVNTSSLKNNQLDFAVFPNPVRNGNLNYRLTLTEFTQNVNLTVFDLSGKVVINKTLGNLPAGTSLEQLNVDGLSAGMYFVKVNSASGSSTLKFVKE